MLRCLLLWATMLVFTGCMSDTARITPPPLRVVKPPKLKNTVVATMRSSANVVVDPLPTHWLTWNWSLTEGGVPVQLPFTNVANIIEFDVEHRLDLQTDQWSLFCRTNQPPVPFQYNQNQEYFRVGVHVVSPTTGESSIYFYDPDPSAGQ